MGIKRKQQTTWEQHGVNTGTAWEQWEQHGDSTGTSREQHGNSTGTAWEQRGDMGTMGTNGTMGNWTQVDDDELEDPNTQKEEDDVENECKEASCKPLPATQVLKIQILYTKALAEKLGSKKKARRAINQVMTHVQAYYCHETLGSKLKIKVKFLTQDVTLNQQNCSLQPVSKKPKYVEEDWTASVKTLNRLKKLITGKYKDNKADLFVAISSDDVNSDGSVGLAWTSVVCQSNAREYHASISEYR